MTEDFAIKWALGSLAFFALGSFAGIAFRMALPNSPLAVFALGGLVGAITVAPIVYVAVCRE